MNDSALAQAADREPGWTRQRLQLVVFLLVLPLANVLFTGTVLYDLGLLDARKLVFVAARLWLIFGLAYAILRLLERHFPALLRDSAFWRSLLIHIGVTLALAVLIGPQLAMPEAAGRPNSMFMPRVFLILQIVIYVAVLRILAHQKRSFEAAAHIKEAELSTLRAQSNPHFLFNTLNLITSEISRDAQNAKTIVFDLADLLRSNLKIAQRSRATLSDELHLVSLYLTLQKQRFRDRLTFDVEVAPDSEGLSVPALLLQPVIENTVKWAVAPYASAAHIRVSACRRDGVLDITVADTGPEFDESDVVEGNGFRILRQTLELHYPGRWYVALKSTPDGGLMRIRLPAIRFEPDHE